MQYTYYPNLDTYTSFLLNALDPDKFIEVDSLYDLTVSQVITDSYILQNLDLPKKLSATGTDQRTKTSQQSNFDIVLEIDSKLDNLVNRCRELGILNILKDQPTNYVLTTTPRSRNFTNNIILTNTKLATKFPQIRKAKSFNSSFSSAFN